MNIKHKQAGGTIIGMIIGLIIGLAIAVVVAMMITKTPVPFVNRNARQDKPVDTAAGQMVDLNKSLYGNRAPAKEAAKEFAREPAEAAPATAADAAVAGGDKKADAKPAADAKAPVIDKSIAERAKKGEDSGKTADVKETAKADAAEEKWTYYLQAGAFRDQVDAESAKAKLALLGVETRISERASDNGTLYRVRVGPFGQVETMNKTRSKLSENGVDVAVVRIPK